MFPLLKFRLRIGTNQFVFSFFTLHLSFDSYTGVSQVYPGDVPSTVRRLLFSTKRLQEVLRHWSKEQASEGDVSDVYVQIGHEFNAVIAAFAFHSIDLRCVGFTSPL